MKSAVCTAATILIIGAMFWASPYRKSASPIPVELAPCERADIFNAVTLRGKAEAKNRQRVFAPGAGVVEEVYIAPGDRVEQGQALMKLTLVQDAAGIQQAVGEETQKLLDTLAQDAQDGAFSQESGELLARAASAGAQVPALPPQETSIVLTAPGAGTVMDVFCAPGESVSSLLPCVTLADLRSLMIRAQVGEEELPQLQAGQEATVEFEAFPQEEPRNGRVEQVSPYAKTSGILGQSSQISTDVIVGFDNAAQQIGPGYSATVKIKTEKKSQALLLPYDAVEQDEQNREYVLVVQGNRARKQLVETGFELSDQVEILAGLTGEELVIASPKAISSGQRVEWEETP